MAGFTGSQQTCVDDSIVVNDSIEKNFFDICQFLEIGGKGGCTFNPAIFQFVQMEVDFLGFKITLMVSRQMLNSLNILHFPAPTNITDVQAWQGAIKQISFSFDSAPIMAPFRHLLSAKVPFQWTTELQEAFNASKQEIVAKCSKGVRSFDPKLPTALATNWSKLGLGYWVTQKYCSYPPLPCDLAVVTLDDRLYTWAADSANPLSLGTIPLKVRLSVYFAAWRNANFLY